MNIDASSVVAEEAYDGEKETPSEASLTV